MHCRVAALQKKRFLFNKFSLINHTNASILQEEGYIVYENHMSSSYEVGIGPRGSITRDSHFE